MIHSCCPHLADGTVLLVNPAEYVDLKACLLFFAHDFVFTEKKEHSPEATITAFSTETLPITTYVNGISPNPPSSEDALSPKPSPPLNEPFTGPMHPESQVLPSLTRAPTHQLLSMHHTLFEADEEQGGGSDRLASRSGELITAGEC